MFELIPHGICLSSEPALVGALVAADFMIFASYVGLSLMLLKLNRTTRNVPIYSRMSLWFAAFIVLCGLTHFAAIVTMYVGGYAYLVQTLICVTTGIVSLATMVMLWQLVPDIQSMLKENV